MLIVLLAVFVALIVFSFHLYNHCDAGMVSEAIGIISVIVSAIIIVVMVVLGIKISKAPIMDDKIALYEETNAEIDEQIADMVTQYKDYEAGTLADLKTDSAITLVNLYPELKSDELVQSQMDVYISNKKQIMSLKEEKLSMKPRRWWLYFGG